MNSYLLQCAIRDVLAPELARLPLAGKVRPMRSDVLSLKPTAVAGSCPPSSEEAASAELALPTSDAARERTRSTCRAAQIYIGDVLPKQPGSEETVPFICLQERGGHDADGTTRVEIVIRCAVYSREPEEAAHELSNLVAAVRHTLMQNRTLENRYRLLTDQEGRLLLWETPSEQNHPYAESWILSNWEFKSHEGV